MIERATSLPGANVIGDSGRVGPERWVQIGRGSRRGMHCHYCDRPAAFAAESDGVTVGLCETHFQERLEELADADGLDALKEHVDVDRTE